MAKITKVRGGVTVAKGFEAGATAAGIKRSGKPDLGIVHSTAPCTAAGTFTTNKVRAACIDWNEGLLPSGAIRAVVVNAGNANACTGKQGRRDARAMAAQTAAALGASEREVLVASTGVIGEMLPMDKVAAGISACARRLSPAGGGRFAGAILTTDLVKKEYAVRVPLSGGVATVGGCAKGSGMIHPNMATMLAFVTTDAAVGTKPLHALTRDVVNATFNNLTVDGDTSTNDMLVVLANGVSGAAVRTAADRALFKGALFEVCNNLCAMIAADGEGATKRVEINVRGGRTYGDCRLAAKAIANSCLVKTALFGCDPNWGRILAALGYSGAGFSPANIELKLCGVAVCRALRPLTFDRKALAARMGRKVVHIDVDLGTGGKSRAVAHTCDLTYDYVKINAEYHT